ncbi:MAG: radical SAM family heme chaperone HemW, partial [Balneolaceae bacterium]|nr:radical SAM family heme chaperone HemW [Balneolaceae bacterium]
MSGIYIHVPFCRQACSYCDFYFLTRGELKDPFVEALVREIRSYENSPLSGDKIETIYFGGGTPSLLRERQLEKIFETLHDIFQIDAQEVTMELNPDDVTPDYLELIRGFGVNRASMGIQSFQSEILTFMNRAHTSEEAIKALEALRSANFPSYTADLIYGNPGQTLNMLEEDLATLLSYSPPHVSAYSLTVESGTRLGKQVELGRISPPEDEEVASHFDLVREKLGKAGIQQYEVSNFSKPGKEAVHNSSYWSHKNYLGFGPSAHSFVWDVDGARRWNNVRNLKRYLNEDITDIR